MRHRKPGVDAMPYDWADVVHRGADRAWYRNDERISLRPLMKPTRHRKKRIWTRR